VKASVFIATSLDGYDEFMATVDALVIGSAPSCSRSWFIKPGTASRSAG